MEIKIIPFTDLLKQELPEFVENVIAVVEKHKPVDLKIKEIFDLLVAQRPNCNFLTQPYGAHPLTAQLSPLRKKRLIYAQRIVYNMGTVMKENEGKLTNAMFNTNIEINRYLHRLDLCKNEVKVVKLLRGFFVEFDSNAIMQEAFEEFALMRDCDSLRSAHNGVNELLLERGGSISGRPSKTRKELSDPIVVVVKDFFMQVRVASVKNTELDYVPLISECNKVISYYRNLINLRKLTNKRKAKELELEESNNESTNPENETTLMMKSLNVETMLGNGFEKRFDEQLDQKKTVASSGKLTQLPSVNNEA